MLGPATQSAAPGPTAPFRKRAVNRSPRLWIAQPALGWSANHQLHSCRLSDRGGCQNCVNCNVHMLWKNLLITCGGLG